eukprot:gene5737-biopygen13315
MPIPRVFFLSGNGNGNDSRNNVWAAVSKHLRTVTEKYVLVLSAGCTMVLTYTNVMASVCRELRLSFGSGGQPLGGRL